MCHHASSPKTNKVFPSVFFVFCAKNSQYKKCNKMIKESNKRSLRKDCSTHAYFVSFILLLYPMLFPTLNPKFHIVGAHVKNRSTSQNTTIHTYIQTHITYIYYKGLDRQGWLTYQADIPSHPLITCMLCIYIQI